MTFKEQQILNASIRLALRKGELPFIFTDDQEKTYRKLVYEMGKELGKKFSAHKDGDKWQITLSTN